MKQQESHATIGATPSQHHQVDLTHSLAVPPCVDKLCLGNTQLTSRLIAQLHILRGIVSHSLSHNLEKERGGDTRQEDH